MIGHGVPLMTRRNRRVWLAKRRHLLGATDAAAVLGYSTFRTPLDVWGEKSGHWPAEDLAGKYAVKRGNALEPLLVAEWAKQRGAQVADYPMLVAHPEYPMIGASLDALGIIDGQPVICEAKAVGWRSRDAWWDDQVRVPDSYAVQVLIQMAVTGVDVAHVCADVAGEFTVVEVPRDHDFERWALPYLADWWAAHVAGGIPPEVDAVADYRHLNRVWVPDPGLSRPATVTETAMVAAWIGAKAARSDAEREAESLRGSIRKIMQHHTALTDDQDQPLVKLTASGSLTTPKRKENTTS